MAEQWGTTELSSPKEVEPTMDVGLASLPAGVHFQCGTCEYFSDGVCHNEHPSLNGQKVDSAWCCNRYDRQGMKVIVNG